MKNFIVSSRLPAVLLAAVFLMGTSVEACSSAAQTGSGDSSCAALTSCCGTILGQTTQSCGEMVQAAQGSSISSCAQLLESYQAAGFCGGLDGGGGSFDAGVVSTVDAGWVACAFTGTCDAAVQETTSQCVPIGSCADGLTYQVCTQSAAGSACAASIVFSDGTQMACASCTDCAAASANAVLHCEPQSWFDAGPSGIDASTVVDAAPSCGTSPVLHPQTEPGVYCPFTAAGAVHCAVGEECCEAPAGSLSTCQSGGACPVMGSLAWECADPVDCQGNAEGTTCCAIGGTTTFDSTCSYYRGSGFTGSQCAASCGAGQVEICSAESGCTNPAQECTPFKVAGIEVGTCL